MKFGFNIQVFEQASELREVGAGIGLGPNAVKVLRALGLEQKVRGLAFEAERFEGRDWMTGEILFRTPMKGASLERYGAAHYKSTAPSCSISLAPLPATPR